MYINITMVNNISLKKKRSHKTGMFVLYYFLSFSPTNVYIFRVMIFHVFVVIYVNISIVIFLFVFLKVQINCIVMNNEHKLLSL